MPEPETQTAVEEEYVPSFIGVEFEQWWAKRYSDSRPREEWPVIQRACYEAAREAWLYAFQRGLDVNY